MAILPVHKQYISVAAKIVAEQIASKSDGPGSESHIYNIYEQLGMPLSDIEEIMDAALAGRLENVQEKVDGQNITFTVVNGVVQFFSKMDLNDQRSRDRARDRILRGDGATPDDIARKYTDDKGMGALRETYTMAYEALTPIASKYSDSLFQNGNVVVVSSLATPRNPNTILYEEDNFIFIKPIALQEGTFVDESAYSNFLSDAEKEKESVFNMSSVPTAKLIKELEEDDDKIEELKSDFRDVVGEAGLSVGSDTVGDYVLERVEDLIYSKYKFIPDDMVRPVALRFVTGRGAVANALKKSISSDDYRKYQDLDKRKSQIVDEAIIPLEEIVQRLGVMVADRLDLALRATNSNELLSLVKTVRSEFERGASFIDNSMDPQKAKRVSEGIRVALERLKSNEDLFRTATEGIVFTWKDGKTYKLTGLFTPINKLRGFFAYSGAQSPSHPETSESETVRERVRRRWKKHQLVEGGSAFKDSSGSVLTRKERIPRRDVDIILKSFEDEVLKPLGINYMPVGSTATNTGAVGDIDIAVDIASRNVLADVLMGHIDREKVKKLPGLVAVMFKVPDSDPEEFVQIDVVPSSNISDTQWLMMGAQEGGVKGVYRNLLLAYLAKTKSDKESSTLQSVKYTITFPGGLLKKVNGSAIGEREHDPDVFLPVLGFPKDLSKDNIESFEQLVDYMRGDPSMSTILPGFKDYIDNNRYLRNSNKMISDEAKMAADYIDEKSLMESMIKKRITELLTEAEQFSLPGILSDPEPGSSVSRIDHAWLNAHAVTDPLYTGGNGEGGVLHPAGFSGLALGIRESTQRNDGERFEDGMVGYADELVELGGYNAVPLKREGLPGTDLSQLVEKGGKGRTYELKKSTQNSPNLMLNASFPKSDPNHYYVFVVNLPNLQIMTRAWEQLESQSGGDLNKAWADLEAEVQKRVDVDRELTFFINDSKARDSAADEIESGEINPDSESSALVVPLGVMSSAQRFIKMYEAYGELNNISKEDALDYMKSKTGKITSGSLKGVRTELRAQYSETKSGAAAGTRGELFKNVLGNVKLWVVPSRDLRIEILSSNEALRSAIDMETGELIKGGREVIAAALRSELTNLKIEDKIVEKIAPLVEDQVLDGVSPSQSKEDKDPAFDIRLGLLKVRISLKIEPPKGV